jgi:hypothetical protein
MNFLIKINIKDLDLYPIVGKKSNNISLVYIKKPEELNKIKINPYTQINSSIYSITPKIKTISSISKKNY